MSRKGEEEEDEYGEYKNSSGYQQSGTNHQNSNNTSSRTICPSCGTIYSGPNKVCISCGLKFTPLDEIFR